MAKKQNIGRILALLLFAAPAVAAPDDSLQRVVAARTLSIGVAINAPWVIKKPDGTLVGYDIDLVKTLAKDLGATPRFVELPFRDLISSVAKGDVDIAAAGLAITPARARDVVFSTPTGVAVVRTVAYQAPANPAERKKVRGRTVTASAMLGAGAKIAVLAGSTGEAAAKAAYPSATIVPFPSAHDALAALLDGQTQAMVATSPVPRLAASLYDQQLRLVGPPLSRTAEAFALQPGDDRLQDYIDNWIEARKADGMLRNLRRYWFFGSRWIGALEPANAAPAASRK